MKKKGLFITIEGGEACGKSTQVELLKKHFAGDVIFVREPGATSLGEKIRQELLHDENVVICGRAELLLFIAARVELYEEVIKPALESGKTVIADRFYDSTVAYQGFARGVMSGSEILSLNKRFLNGLTPNLTIYLRLEPEIAFKRKNGGLDKFEREELDFHKRVYEGYEYMSKAEPERFVIVDASKSIDEVATQVLGAIENKLHDLA